MIGRIHLHLTLGEVVARLHLATGTIAATRHRRATCSCRRACSAWAQKARYVGTTGPVERIGATRGSALRVISRHRPRSRGSGLTLQLRCAKPSAWSRCPGPCHGRNFRRHLPALMEKPRAPKPGRRPMLLTPDARVFRYSNQLPHVEGDDATLRLVSSWSSLPPTATLTAVRTGPRGFSASPRLPG
jgi:hypothetical protein